MAAVLSAQLMRGLIAPGMATLAAVAAADPPAPTAMVHEDGSVVISAATATEAAKERPAVSCQFSFGLPSARPVRRWLEDGRLPIARTQWETNGIRYSQIVLLTRLEPGALGSGGGRAADAVLLVQLLGENMASEYTEATAEFSMRLGGEARELELREDRVAEVGSGDRPPLAVVAIPATGISIARGLALCFRGHMPPGTSGSMTLKIPLQPLNREAALDRLRELEFDEEFRRVKRFWTDQLKAAPLESLPIAFAPEGATPLRREP